MYNPRVINNKALEGLKFSLDEFGDISGIVFNKQTGNLVAGHQRVKALTEKYGNLEIVNGEIVTPKGNFLIRFVDWNEQKEKAANIAANSESIQGKWTEDASIILEDVALFTPELFAGLNFSDLTVPEFTVGQETIEVEKQTSDISQEHRNSLKFGDVTIYLSESELEDMTRCYKNYIQRNKNTYGFVTYLLEGK